MHLQTTVLGVEVDVTKIAISPDGEIVAICTLGKHRQPIGLLNPPTPTPRPAGAEWIDAYQPGPADEERR